MRQDPSIIFVSNNSAYLVTHRLALLRAAMSAGYRVHIASPEGPARSRLTSEGFYFHEIPFGRGTKGLWSDVDCLFRLISLYASVKPRLVHHLTLKPIVLGTIAARITCRPATINAVTGLGYSFIAQDRFSRALRVFVKTLYKLSLSNPRSIALFQNPDDQSDFINWGLVDTSRTALVRGTGINTEVFSFIPESAGIPIVAFPSRMLRHKGILEFVDAARILKKKNVIARYVLIGDVDPGNPSSLSRRQLEEWVTEGIVEWWGHCTDMPATISRCHIICLPSYREGLPRVLIEAAACGRPVVAFDVPGSREIVRHMVNGALALERTSYELSGALETLIADKHLRKRLGEQGREIACSEFSEQIVNVQTLAVYERAWMLR